MRKKRGRCDYCDEEVWYYYWGKFKRYFHLCYIVDHTVEWEEEKPLPWWKRLIPRARLE